MEVILMERVEKLGQMGDVVTVKNGYARNFLLPQNKALRANKGNLSLFENQRHDLEARNLESRKEAESVSAKLDGKSVVLLRQASEMAVLYGSVSARDIATALTEDGVTVDRKQIALQHPIKSLGLHNVKVVLHPEISLSVEVNVARSEEEAELQALGEETDTAEFFDTEEAASEAESELSASEEIEGEEADFSAEAAPETATEDAAEGADDEAAST